MWSATATGALPLRGFNHTSTTVDQCRAYGYLSNSRVASIVGVSTGASVPGQATSTLPPQVCVVASLLTGFAGRGSRGRIYLPVTGASTDSTFHANFNVQQMATSVANYLSQIRTQSVAGTTTVPIVGSTTVGGSPIASVRVDDVLDTQRRRRDKITANTIGSANLIVG